MALIKVSVKYLYIVHPPQRTSTIVKKGAQQKGSGRTIENNFKFPCFQLVKLGANLIVVHCPNNLINKEI